MHPLANFISWSLPTVLYADVNLNELVRPKPQDTSIHTNVSTQLSLSRILGDRYRPAEDAGLLSHLNSLMVDGLGLPLDGLEGSQRSH
jgi:hypothetical protein